LPFRLFSIMQMPRFVPPWDTLMDDLGRPSPERVARALGVGRSTVYRWNSSGRAPRAASLAVFWLTRWGRSEIDAQATNDALMALQLARSLADDLAALRGQPARQGDCLRPATAKAGGLAPKRGKNSELQTGSARGDGPRLIRTGAKTTPSRTREKSAEFCVVSTETSPPRPRARVAPSMPPKKPRKR